MKKNHGIAYYGMLAWMTGTALVLTSSCSGDLPEMSSNRITITVKDPGFDEGRTLTRGSMANAVSTMGVSAAVYDKDAVGGYSSAGCGSYFYNEAVTSGTPTDFFWPTSDYKMAFYAHHPYGNAAFTVQSAANALGAPTYAYTVPSAIASQVDVMTGQNVNVLGGGTAAVSLTMKHRCAAVRFSVTNNRSTAITLSSVSIEGVKYSGTLCEDTWTLSSAVNSSSSNPFTLSYGGVIDASGTADVTGTTNVFLMLPQAIPAGAKVKVVVEGEDPLYADLSGTWLASKRYNYSLAIKNNVLVIMDEESEVEDWITTIDLSMVDNAGTARESMTTANCYMVHRAGKYKLPLVYGNAIKEGEVNTVSFRSSASSSASILKPFVNHNGDGISGPWITKNGTGVDAGMGLTAASAELLWQDAEGLIYEVGIEGDYLKFTVGTFTPGNALIAVKDGTGTILWSWHIWATAETYTTTTDVNGYGVAPVNLGWVPEEGSDNKRGYCPYYQWGRKDPFPPSDGVSETNHTLYGSQTSVIFKQFVNCTSNHISQGIAGNFANSIKYPFYYYHNNITDSSVKNSKNVKAYYGRNGEYETYEYNLWDAGITTTGMYQNRTAHTVKTVYDPCPPDFCVPSNGLFYYMANTVTTCVWDGSTYYGAMWNNEVWFPAAGFRHYASGSIDEVNVQPYYWSSTPNSEALAWRLYKQSNTKLGVVNNPRGYGMAIRPVVE